MNLIAVPLNCLTLSLLFLFLGWQVHPQENQLPLLSIKTFDTASIPASQEYVYAKAVLLKSGKEIKFDSLKIRTRGNSTSSFPKKPYQLKFERQTGLLDMPSDQRWILLANYSDKTMLRTNLAFELSRASSLQFTPESRFIELEINDEYLGTYQLTQKVEQSPNRVDIGPKGFLLEVEMPKRIDSDDVCFTTRRETICIKAPEITKADPEFNQIKEQLLIIEKALYSDDFDNPNSGWRRYIDEQSLIDWYLVNEITKNNDAKFHTSVFMTYRPGEKLKMGPIWDFDISLGNIDYNGNENPKGFWIRRAPWISRLFKDSLFKDHLKARFNHFYEKKTAFKEMLSSKASQLSKSQQSNDAKWQVIGKKVWPNYKNFDTYQEEVDYLIKWFDTRMDWLYTAINKF